MLIVANKKNLRKYGPQLVEKATFKDAALKALINCCEQPVRPDHEHLSRAVIKRLEQIGNLIGMHGVESIYQRRNGEPVDGPSLDADEIIEIHFCKAGDTRAMTILWWDGKFRIGDWDQSWMHRGDERERDDHEVEGIDLGRARFAQSIGVQLPAICQTRRFLMIRHFILIRHNLPLNPISSPYKSFLYGYPHQTRPGC